MSPEAPEPTRGDEGWFIASLAAGAPYESLVRTWESLPPEGRTTRVLAMAARASILPTFARFVERHPGSPSDPSFSRVVALGLLAGGKLTRALSLLGDVATRTEVRGTCPIAIKGAGLTLSGHYGRGERDADDVDLVVPPDSAADWRRAALASGAGWTDLPEGPGGTYQVARIARGSAHIELHVALFGDASLIPGIPYDRLLPFSEDAHPEHGIDGVRTMTAAAAREVAVHHFVFHHRGAETCAFQAMQDVARLDAGAAIVPGASGLPWNAASPVAATALVRRVVRRLQSNSVADDEETRTFLRPLVAALEGGDPTAPSYAETIDEMSRLLASSGTGGAARLFWTLFPPLARMRRRPDEALLVTAARYAVRPPMVVARYLRTRRSQPAAEAFRRWHTFVAAGGQRRDAQ